MAKIPIYKKPQSLTNTPTHYCPGCGHGILHKIIAEVIDKLGVREKTIGVAPVGCAVLAYFYWNFDVSEAAHGRVPAVATGIKRVLPENVVFAYQGDGDLAAIGMAETIHTANRGEPITVIFSNNTVYGMTGGQMAPTTLTGQKTVTTPEGRDYDLHGPPIKICELLNTLDKPYYIERTALSGIQGIYRTKKAIENAFKAQIEHHAYSFVEVLTPCPTYQRRTPVDALKFVEEQMAAHFPVRIFRQDGKAL